VGNTTVALTAVALSLTLRSFRQDKRMRLLIAIFFAGLLAACAARPYSFERLAFGMTKEETAAALGAPLTYVSGRRGAEVYAIEQPAGIPWYHPSEERLFLQFRKDRLTGWKNEWDVRRSGF
jgi:hypothetical protein